MKQPIKWVLMIAAIAIVAFVFFGQNGKGVNSISVTEAQAMIAKDSTVIVLDVRTPAEYIGDLGHVEHSVLIPVQELEQRMGELEKYKGRKILAICRTGRRSGNATGILVKSGFDAVNVGGGMVKWKEAGLPVAQQ
jgi:rhodanese-related sulfurtransferase